MLADRHGLYDDRIYWKEALSLTNKGYSVTIVINSGSSEQGTTAEGIHFIKIKKREFSGNRFLNYLLNLVHPTGLYPSMLREVAKLQPVVCHLHDLNLNRIGGKLKKLPGKPKIIYDVHEPHPENILDYFRTKGVASLLKKWYAGYIRWWEQKCSKRYDLVITTEDNLYRRFAGYLGSERVQIIYNYTDLNGTKPQTSEPEKVYDAIYCGGITEFRGAFKILEAVRIAARDLPGIKVLFLGTYFPAELKARMEAFVTENNLDQNIVLKNSVPYKEVPEFYSKSRIGLGIFLPILSHRIILQIKIFEYMAFGLPVIGSNFGHISKYIRENRIGIEVDPGNPEEIARALIELLTNKDLYAQLSRNSQEASVNCRWGSMEQKLADIYQSLLTDQSSFRSHG